MHVFASLMTCLIVRLDVLDGGHQMQTGASLGNLLQGWLLEVLLFDRVLKGPGSCGCNREAMWLGAKRGLQPLLHAPQHRQQTKRMRHGAGLELHCIGSVCMCLTCSCEQRPSVRF